MADKASTLSIVIRTVDQATAGLKAIGGVINKITAPARAIGERFQALGKAAGFSEIAEGFKGVGGAAKAFGEKLLWIGGAVAAVTLAMFHLIGEFDDLGDLSERLGVSNDFLASMRYAAEKAGAKTEALDAGLQSLTENLGQARAGTGRMTAFLEKVSPALLTQLKAAKGTEAAFLLLGDAMAKIKDPAKRAALAQKTVGDSALAPMLAQGRKGLTEQRAAFIAHAGSMEEAAVAAGKVDDAMHDMNAAFTGVKAALVSGLGPALGQLVAEITAWFSENRERVAEWASTLGKKLPGAIHTAVDAFLNALDSVEQFVDSVGGLKTIAIALAAVLVGPLLYSIGALGVAILTTPIGWILAGIAALAAGAYLIIKNWDGIKAFFIDLWASGRKEFGGIFALMEKLFAISPLGLIIKNWEPVKAFFGVLWDGIVTQFKIGLFFIESALAAVNALAGAISAAIDLVDSAIPDFSIGGAVDASTNVNKDFFSNALGGQRSSETRVKVDFANAPKGMRVSTDPQNKDDVDMTVGYQLGGGGVW